MCNNITINKSIIELLIIKKKIHALYHITHGEVSGKVNSSFFSSCMILILRVFCANIEIISLAY